MWHTEKKINQPRNDAIGHFSCRRDHTKYKCNNNTTNCACQSDTDTKGKPHHGAGKHIPAKPVRTKQMAPRRRYITFDKICCNTLLIKQQTCQYDTDE